MRTVIETPTFAKEANKVWSDDERLDFISWISVNPLAGEVIKNADGARKVRWAAKGKGKRGGVRIIYFNMDFEENIYLITLYSKNEKETISSAEIKEAL